MGRFLVDEALPRSLARHLRAASFEVDDIRDPEGCEVRTFGAFTADLYALAAWLTRCGIETVAMESTGVPRPAKSVGQEPGDDGSDGMRR